MPTRRPPIVTAAVFILLVAIAAASRLMPHAPNLAAVAAVAIFAGWFFRSRLLALAAPLAAMALSDAFVGGYQPGVMAAVYLSFAAPVFFRRIVGPRQAASPHRILLGASVSALAASVLFFLTTNLAVFAFSGYYAHTSAGLAECFAAALPFFRYTLLGDQVCVMAIFSAYFLLARTSQSPLAPAASTSTLSPAISR